MRFLKAHYEKIILSIVLLGLAAAVAYLPLKLAGERSQEDERNKQLIEKKVNPFPPIDLASNIAVLERLDRPVQNLKLSGDHNLFNPVRWQRLPDGSIRKGTVSGLNALHITAINPLKLKVAYEGTSGMGTDLKYIVSIVRETDRTGKQTRTSTVGGKNTLFKLDSVNGPADNPSDLSITLAGEKQPVTIAPQQPYERIIGYAADLQYDAVGEAFTKKNLRVRDEVSFGGETYAVVAVTPNEVIVSAKSNKKQTPIEFKPQ